MWAHTEDSTALTGVISQGQLVYVNVWIGAEWLYVQKLLSLLRVCHAASDRMARRYFTISRMSDNIVSRLGQYGLFR